jgi:hypothetical protein
MISQFNELVYDYYKSARTPEEFDARYGGMDESKAIDEDSVDLKESLYESRNKIDTDNQIRQQWQARLIHKKLKPALRDKYGVMHVEVANVHGGHYFHFGKLLTDDEINDVLRVADSVGVGIEFYKNVNGTMSKRTPCSLFKVLPLDPDSYQESLTEAMTYTDTNGFLGEPGETYTMSQFRRMWQDKDNDPVMSGYDSFEEWVGETISQMDSHEDSVAPSGRGKLSCAIFTDKSGIMGTAGEKYTVNDLADYWESNKGSDPVLAEYKGDWKAWLDNTIAQMEIDYDSCLFEEGWYNAASYSISNLMRSFAEKLNGHFKQEELSYEAVYREDVHHYNMGADVQHVIGIFSTDAMPDIEAEFICGKSVGDWYESYTIKSNDADGNLRTIASGTFYDSMIDEIDELCFTIFEGFDFQSVKSKRAVSEGLESKTFTDKEEAKKFAKDNKGAITSVVDDKLNPTHYVHYKGKEEPVEEAFEDMLKDPEVQHRNAEYADKMKAKHDKENELAKEAKNWPDDKELTYEEALALAKAYYAQGGDGFYETTEKYQFDDEVKMFGPMTVGQMKRDFGVFDSVSKDRMSESKEELTETTSRELDSRKKNLYRNIRSRLGVNNLIGSRDKWSEEEKAEYEELSCIDMLHSILTYASSHDIDYVMGNEYLKRYIDAIGEERVRELALQEIEEFKSAVIDRNAMTDSEGVTYSSVRFKDE